ncbi:MAG: hypothetical protein PHW79_06485 [Candidatus Marinimicrobia bacterium]|nr:hypothetical protein [Candidatus Neomarinimicrobiota bacterium]
MFKKAISVFWEPSATFASLKQHTTWMDVIIPLLIVVIVSIVTLPYISPIAVSYQKGLIEKSERFTDEQKDAVYQRMEKQTNPLKMSIMTTISIIVKALVITLVLWFAGNFLLGGEAKYLVIFALTAYVGLIDLASMAVKYPLIISQQSIQIYTGPALFFEDNGSFLFRFLTTLDIFAVWKVIVSSIGLSVIYNKKLGKSVTIVTILWLIYGVGASLLGGLTKM